MDNKEHPLVLRVMRLTKPSIINSIPVTNEALDIYPKSLGHCTNSLNSFGTGELLVLPQSFGNIFLGETFVSYLSVINESTDNISSVKLKADLQTESHRLPVSLSTPIPNLAPGYSLDEVISHEVKELGTHILVCIVTYNKPDGEVRNFRKFFKFQVLKPLDVKTKFYNVESDEVYLETQIQNITQSSICMDKVNLDPSPMYEVRPLNQGSDADSHTFMKASEIRQYLYRLKLKPEHALQVFSESAGTIGKLDIVWKSSFGERGRLQTSQLQRAVTSQCDIRLQVKEAPSQQAINLPFAIKCKITNYSERAKCLKVQYENTTRMLWQGLSGYELAKLASKDSVDLEMLLLPISPGLQTVSGLRITDTELNRTYDFDDIHQVLVLSSC